MMNTGIEGVVGMRVRFSIRVAVMNMKLPSLSVDEQGSKSVLARNQHDGQSLASLSSCILTVAATKALYLQNPT